MRIIFLGPPGVGKGSYADVIAPKLNIAHISMGDLLRDEIRENTEIGKKIKDIVDKGDLVDDDITIKLLERRINKNDCTNGFILDGFPRTLNQAMILEKITNIDVVFEFYASEEKIIERLSGRRICPKCGRIYHIKNNPPKKDNICDVCGTKLIQRDDDKPEAIKERLNIYRKRTEKVIDFYKNKGKLIRVDAEGSIIDVSNEVLRIIKTLL